MTFDQFTQRINQLGTELSNASQIAVKVAGPIVDSIRARAPRDSGALAASIGLKIINDREFYLEMLAYGFFQNYGVDGTQMPRAIAVEDAVKFALPPSGGNRFGFSSETIGGDLPFGVRKSIAEQGLRPKQFFTMAALANQIANAMQQEINNTIN